MIDLQNKELFDKAVSDSFPQKITKAFLERHFGPGEYDIKAINAAFTKPVWQFLGNGGKRLRPALFYIILGCYKDPKDFMFLSAIPEIIHNGTLVADDIEDNSATRRNQPSAHIRHGIDIAVNFGGGMYFLPYLFLKDANPEIKSRVYELISETLLLLHLGQATDIYWHNNPGLLDISERAYLQMCRMKTGMLTGFSCRLAAIVAGISEKELEDFGRMLGVGFQIQDDILNLSGGEKWTKEVGEDITEGKITLLVLHANNKSKEAARLREILCIHTKDKKLIREAIDIIRRAGSIDYAKKKSESLLAKAWERADAFLPSCPNKKKLKELVDFCAQREF